MVEQIIIEQKQIETKPKKVISEERKRKSRKLGKYLVYSIFFIAIPILLFHFLNWIWMTSYLGLFIILKFISIKKRKYFMKDKEGNKLKFKEFMKRWKKGMEGVTPLQQVKTTLWSYPLIFGGIIWGIVVTIINKTYWMSLLLVGALPITVIQVLSQWQKFRVLKRVDAAMKVLNKKENKELGYIN